MSSTNAPKTLLLKNAELLVTMDGERREIKNGGMFIEGNLIRQVGPSDTLPQHADVVLDMAGKVVIPAWSTPTTTCTRASPAWCRRPRWRAVQLADQPVPDLGAPDPRDDRGVDPDRHGRTDPVRLHHLQRPPVHLPQRLQARRQHPCRRRDRHALPRRTRQHERGPQPWWSAA